MPCSRLGDFTLLPSLGELSHRTENTDVGKKRLNILKKFKVLFKLQLVIEDNFFYVNAELLLHPIFNLSGFPRCHSLIFPFLLHIRANCTQGFHLS